MRSLGEDFDEFVVAASPGLLLLALRLSGDRGDAEDLLQTALWRVARNWPVSGGNPVGYARRVIVNLQTDSWRRRRHGHREISVAVMPERPADEPPTAERQALVAALFRLPPRQRTIVVLRYWEDLSVEDTAAMLGCSEGTVKSTASRGLERLRQFLESEEVTS